MVFSPGSEKERLPEFMAMGTERSKPLHNFTLPRLSWGGHRHLRCMKENPVAGDVSDADRRKFESSFPSERRKSAPERREIFLEKRLRVSKSGIGSGGDDDGEFGIAPFGRKLLLDLKTTADNLKNTMLGEEMMREAAEENDNPAETPTLTPAEEKAWNLRTRRGASKAPNSPVSDNGDRKWTRPKFSVALSKNEIEEDFMAMTNRRPRRRSRRRPRNVQKQMDMLFPGLWLSEITADSYKVSENQ